MSKPWSPQGRMDNDAKYAIENNLIDENLAAMLMADVQLLESENDQIIGSAANSSPARGGKNIGRFGSLRKIWEEQDFKLFYKIHKANKIFDKICY